MNCLCGRSMEEKVEGIIQKYKDKKIVINNVPYLICSIGHIRMNRKTRVKLKALTKKAYDENLSEISFTA